MKEMNKRFVPLMEQVHNEMDQEYDSTTTIIDEMLPREGESIIESLIRSRNVISERLLDIMMDKEGFVTPKRISSVIGEKNTNYIYPVMLPHGIEDTLDYIRECTMICSMNDDGSVVYHDDYYGHGCDVNDMQTITHAIVVGNALMLSDPLVTDQDVKDGLDEYVDRNYTILDAINRINELKYTTDNGSPIFHRRHIYHANLIRSPDDTNLGVRMYKERIEALEDDYEDDQIMMFSYFRDNGVVQLDGILGIGLIASIIRYIIELWDDVDNNQIIPDYTITDMLEYMNAIRCSIYFKLSSLEYDIENQDK